MQVIIIGCGKVGSRFARILSEKGHDVVIVDNDRDSFKLLGPDFNGITFAGVPIDQDILKQAGIETADAFAAVTPDDNTNIMACQVAKEIFKVPKVIARIYNPEREHVFHQFGLETICPTNITVGAIRSILLDEVEVSSHLIGDTKVAFKHLKVGKRDEGKTVAQLDTDNDSSIFGIIRNDTFLFAKHEMELEREDIMIIAEKL